MGEEKQKSTPKFTYGNNYRRTRRETQFDTLDMAVSLKHKVSVYVMNDRYVPKRWRYIKRKASDRLRKGYQGLHIGFKRYISQQRTNA